MSKSFRTAFLAAVERAGIPLLQIAKRSGVSYEQLKKLKARVDATTNVEDAIRLAQALGLTIDELLEDRLAEERDAVVALWQSLTPRERQFLRVAAQMSPDPEAGVSR